MPVSVPQLAVILGTSHISKPWFLYLHGKGVRIESVLSAKVVLLCMDILKCYGLSGCMRGGKGKMRIF